MDQLHALTLGDIQAELAASYPERTAVIDDEMRLSFADFDKRVGRLAGTLAGLGVASGDRVVWAAQNSFRYLESLIACAQLGAVFAPLNWRQSAAELAFVLDDAAPRVVIWQEAEIGERVHEAREKAAGGAVWIQHDGDTEESYEARVAAARPLADAAAVDARSPVLMIYTAAFGGRPNGALLSHNAILHQNIQIALVQRISAETVYLNAGPLFHVAALMSTLATWHLGGANVFTPRVDAPELCRLIDAEKCTLSFLMPPTMNQMIEANAEGTYDLSSLRSMPFKRAWNEMVTVDDSPWAKRPGGYGQTELMGLVTCNAAGGEAIASHGRPSPFVRMRVADSEGNDVDTGEPGELVVRGWTVMNGYHDRVQLTEERQRGGWHHTGDLARREADGSLTFIGPMTRIIKSAAENIYPAEVEAAMKTHPGVADVCVLGVPDETWRQRVKAVVVSQGDSEVDDAELIEHTKGQIASYKKPREVVFAESLPRTEAGLVDRDAVDELYGGGGYPGL